MLARDALFRTWGLELEFRQGEAVSPWASTLFTTEAFVGGVASMARSGFKTPENCSAWPEGAVRRSIQRRRFRER